MIEAFVNEAYEPMLIEFQRRKHLVASTLVQQTYKIPSQMLLRSCSHANQTPYHKLHLSLRTWGYAVGRAKTTSIFIRVDTETRATSKA